MTLEQKQKLIDAYKKAKLKYKSANEYGPFDLNTYYLDGSIWGIFQCLEILGLIDSEGNLIE